MAAPGERLWRKTACRTGAAVTLWAREPEVAEAITRQQENTVFLPNVPLDPGLVATSDLTAATDGAELVILVVPAQHLRANAMQLASVIHTDVPVLIAAKGIEIGSGATMIDVARDALPSHPIAILSGPTFAAEVARGLPTAVTVAAYDIPVAEAIVARRSGPRASAHMCLMILLDAQLAVP